MGIPARRSPLYSIHALRELMLASRLRAVFITGARRTKISPPLEYPRRNNDPLAASGSRIARDSPPIHNPVESGAPPLCTPWDQTADPRFQPPPCSRPERS